MSRLFKIFWIALFGTVMYIVPCISQIQTYEEQIRLEMLRRGIEEEDLRLALSDKGIDLDNLEVLSSEELQEIRIIMEELEIEFGNREDLSSESTTFADSVEILLSPTDTLLQSKDSLEQDTSTVAIYGHHFFRNGQIRLISDEAGFIPQGDYILGIGDEIGIGIYGISRLDESFLIDQQGAVRIYKKEGDRGNVRVFVAGLTLLEAREKLITNFKRFYRFTPTQFTLTVTAVRKVRVTVVGEVVHPGEYVVSGLNSVVNLIAGAGGFTDIGGVRSVQLVKRNGQTMNFDLYKYLSEPGRNKSFSIDNGDYIHVPAAQQLVEISGAIRRPHTYELLEGEGIVELIQYAGGLQRGAALASIDMFRYEGDRRVFKEIPYASIIKNRENYILHNGDQISIRQIDERLENYVTILGEVRNPGNYEFHPDLTIKDLILLGRLMPTSRRDQAYIRRTNVDGNITTIPISIESIIAGDGSALNFQLQDKDELTVWALERFADHKKVIISGAVRQPDSFDYDDGGTLRVSDLITLAGGLESDASNYAHIHRLDPFNPQELQYVRVDLDRVLNDPRAADNVFLQPYDSIHIYKRNEYLEDVTIRISGAVNNPGEFGYGEGMTLKDAITLAGGFKLSAATNQIEISRVLIKDNQPTKTIVETQSLSREDLRDFARDEGQYRLEPYDNVFVRYVPQFELQHNVVILGEVLLPGEYSLVKDNETVYDLILRAGGLTEEAFPPAATLYRTEDDLGYLVMRLEEVMDDPRSKFNYALKYQDTITIPKVKDYVKIVGYAQYLIQNGLKQTVTPYHINRDALFYIKEYAGGFADNARTDKIFVKYPNGEVKVTKNRFPFGKKHPEVVPGSTIQIGRKKAEPDDNKDEENVNWTRVLGDSVAQAMSVLTLILLVQRLE